MKIIVTGCAGFIGSELTDELLKQGHQVLGIDNYYSGKESNIKHNLSKTEFEFYFDDICDMRRMEHIFVYYKPDYVYHLAAIPGVVKSVQDPLETNRVNVNGTLNLLELSKRYKIKRFIFSSSSSIYGGAENLPTSEETAPNPKSPYALQKLISEQYCKLYSTQYHLDTACLRYFNVVGERQRADSDYAAVVAAFQNCKKTGNIPKIYGDGEACRDFCPVENVVLANILAMNYKDSLNGEVFNVGCGEKTTINQLAKYFEFKNIKYLSERLGDVKQSQADISKIQKVLGYNVIIDFKNKLDKMNELWQTKKN